MRKVILNLAVTLDAFIEGPNGEVDWCILDDDMKFEDFVSDIDTIFYGRISYDTWGKYNPQDYSNEADKALWREVHAKKKYVFSHEQRNDDNAIFVSNDIVANVKKIKQEPGNDIWLYGGAGLIKTFIENNLIDIYMISVHPVALGTGKPMFENLRERQKLELIRSHQFRSGVVQLVYRPFN